MSADKRKKIGKPVEADTLKPDQLVVLQAPDQVGLSGILKDLQSDLPLRLQDLATLSIMVSDNTAVNSLIFIVIP